MEIPEHITGILAYIFPDAFLVIYESIFSKNLLSKTDRKIQHDLFANGGSIYVIFNVIIFIWIIPHV